MASRIRLSFEKEIYEREDQLANLEGAINGPPTDAEETRRLRRGLIHLKRRIYNNLTPWQIIEVDRDPDRPQTLDYIDLIIEEFVEIPGDRAVGDAPVFRTRFVRSGAWR